jgi:hypothetical protein
LANTGSESIARSKDFGGEFVEDFVEQTLEGGETSTERSGLQNKVDFRNLKTSGVRLMSA